MTAAGRPGPVVAPSDFKRAFQRFQRDEMTRWAAAMTYYSLLSLFPALLLGVALLGVFGQQSLINEASSFLISVGAPRETVDRFAARFGVNVIRESDQTITHNLRTAVIGPDGRLVSVYSGSDWTPSQVVDDLRRALRQ